VEEVADMMMGEERGVLGGAGYDRVLSESLGWEEEERREEERRKENITEVVSWKLLCAPGMASALGFIGIIVTNLRAVIRIIPQSEEDASETTALGS
jgi:hypothetical protein